MITYNLKVEVDIQLVHFLMIKF